MVHQFFQDIFDRVTYLVNFCTCTHLQPGYTSASMNLFTRNGVVQDKAQNSGNEHTSGQQNSCDLISNFRAGLNHPWIGIYPLGQDLFNKISILWRDRIPVPAAFVTREKKTENPKISKLRDEFKSTNCRLEIPVGQTLYYTNTILSDLVGQQRSKLP